MANTKPKNGPAKVRAVSNAAQLEKLLELINSEGISCAGYHSLDQDPTIITAVKAIAGLIGMVSWHLMQNTEKGGDQRIKNELSRKIDISPNAFMTRQMFFENI